MTIAILVGFVCLSASCVSSWGEAPPGSVASQFFLTNRAAEPDRNGRVRFVNHPGPTRAGRCTLRVPEQLDGAVSVDRIEAMAQPALFEALDAGKDTGVSLYVHGYDIGLGRACREATVFARRTGYEGRMLLFTWPASRTILTYHRDGARFEASEPALAVVLEELGRRYGRDPATT